MTRRHASEANTIRRYSTVSLIAEAEILLARFEAGDRSEVERIALIRDEIARRRDAARPRPAHALDVDGLRASGRRDGLRLVARCSCGAEIDGRDLAEIRDAHAEHVEAVTR